MHWTENIVDIGRDEARFRVIAAVEPEAIPLVDWKRLENVTFGEPAFRAEIVEMFFEEADRQIAALAGAIVSGSAEAAVRAAHALKGAAANVGADQIRELAGEMETVVNAGGLEFSGLLLERLRQAGVATRAALEAA